VREANLGRAGTLEAYYSNLSAAFLTLVGHEAKLEPLIVDCANGTPCSSMLDLSRDVGCFSHGHVAVTVLVQHTR